MLFEKEYKIYTSVWRDITRKEIKNGQENLKKKKKKKKRGKEIHKTFSTSLNPLTVR
jgi:hypothetical protein